MQFYVTEMRDLRKDDTLYDNTYKVLMLRENNASTSYDLQVVEVKDIAQARRYVQPETILRTLQENLSESEMNMVVLPHQLGSYKFYDEVISLEGYIICDECHQYAKDTETYDVNDKETGEVKASTHLCKLCASVYNSSHSATSINVKEDR